MLQCTVLDPNLLKIDPQYWCGVGFPAFSRFYLICMVNNLLWDSL